MAGKYTFSNKCQRSCHKVTSDTNPGELCRKCQLQRNLGKRSSWICGKSFLVPVKWLSKHNAFRTSSQTLLDQFWINWYNCCPGGWWFVLLTLESIHASVFDIPTASIAVFAPGNNKTQV